MKMFTFIFTIGLIVLLSLALQFDSSGKRLPETLNSNPEEITKLTLNTQNQNKYKSTTDKQEIRTFINHFDQVNYERLRGDVSTYMPMKAGTIYIYENDHSDFIVPYENEVMISYKVYRVKDGVIENGFITKFYNSLD